jgi:signal transduction histidine kinase
VTEIEITEIPPLKPAEQTLLDMHSVLNVFNVLWTELAVIGLALENDATALAESQALIHRLVGSLQDRAASLEAASAIEEHIAAIRAEVDRRIARHAAARERGDIARSLTCIEAVFDVLRVRARELLARAGNPELWVDRATEDLRREFTELLGTMEKASRGRFRIVYHPALQRAGDYYFDLKFETANGGPARLPLIFKDVMRDLVANARKYTAPGGRVSAGLYADPESLRFTVVDTGRGIPPQEITRVVDYGRRGSNVIDVRTMGGGFGLTKAFFVTKQFGGRFWIASELGRGTRVRIEIPADRRAA